jgi:hypothetical protein
MQPAISKLWWFRLFSVIDTVSKAISPRMYQTKYNQQACMIIDTVSIGISWWYIDTFRHTWGGATVLA